MLLIFNCTQLPTHDNIFVNVFENWFETQTSTTFSEGHFASIEKWKKSVRF